jgi:hypothetical protein
MQVGNSQERWWGKLIEDWKFGAVATVNFLPNQHGNPCFADRFSKTISDSTATAPTLPSSEL